MGISKSCYRVFGIPKCLVYGDPHNNMNELKIKHLFGCSFEKDDSLVLSGHEFQVSIDTRRLENDFIIINSYSSKEMASESIKSEIKGTIANVNVNSILSLIYNGIPLRIISFYIEHQPDHED